MPKTEFAFFALSIAASCAAEVVCTPARAFGSDALKSSQA
jgi:hypothetical protein